MCPLSWAQSTQGTILGTVKDSSGASIASATVKLTGVDTGVVKTVQADSSGTYQFLNLNSGNYQVEITADGFNAQVLRNLSLSARQELRAESAGQGNSGGRELAALCLDRQAPRQAAWTGSDCGTAIRFRRRVRRPGRSCSRSEYGSGRDQARGSKLAAGFLSSLTVGLNRFT